MLNPYPASFGDNVIMALLLWRQWVYTLGPLVQIALNEHYRQLPNICMQSQLVKGGIVACQLALLLMGFGRYGLYFRMSILIRDGILNAVLFMQLGWYRRSPLKRARKNMGLDNLE
jgi:hypothetical protein